MLPLLPLCEPSVQGTCFALPGGSFALEAWEEIWERCYRLEDGLLLPSSPASEFKGWLKGR